MDIPFNKVYPVAGGEPTMNVEMVFQMAKETF